MAFASFIRALKIRNASLSRDMAFNSMSNVLEFLDNILIGDSGASCHYCNSAKGLFDIKETAERITVGNGNTKGKLKNTV
jgi:hypothetical protein